MLYIGEWSYHVIEVRCRIVRRSIRWKRWSSAAEKAKCLYQNHHPSIIWVEYKNLNISSSIFLLIFLFFQFYNFLKQTIFFYFCEIVLQFRKWRLFFHFCEIVLQFWNWRFSLSFLLNCLKWVILNDSGIKMCTLKSSACCL